MQAIVVLVALAAIVIGIINQRLPTIIEKVVTLERDSTGLERLRIGHAMAGGGSTGAEAMADAIKTTLLSKVFGVSSTKSRKAWRSLTETMREAERRYLSPSWGFGLGPEDFAANEIAEGLLYVSHVTKLALDVYLEKAPRFVRLVSPHLKLIGDNPDAQYHIASLRTHGGDEQKKEFVVKGCRGTHEVYFSFSIHVPGDGKGLSSGAFERVVTDVNDEQIKHYDENGCYKLYLSSTNPGESVLQGATWLKTPQESSSLVTRHYFNSWPPGAIDQTVYISIELADVTPNHTPEPVSDHVIAARIDLANDFIRRHTILMPQPDPTTAPPFFSLLPNTIGIPQKWQRGEEGMGAVDIAYAAGRFRLEDDEALILQGAVPPCRFANVVLWNRFLQTFDYSAFDDFPIFYTLQTPSKGEEDTQFSIVLSRNRPKGYTGKWLFTEGRPMGTVFFRFLLPEGDQSTFQKITTKVITADEVMKRLS